MKNTKVAIISFALSLFLVTLFFSACKKENSSGSGSQQLSLYLTDDPALFDSVLIDIQKVEVKIDTSEEHQHNDHFGDIDNDNDDDHQDSDAFGQWIDLAMTPGVYTVSNLRNGIDMLLASGTITGKIRKVRITLGTNNTVYVGGVAHALALSGSDNLVYVKIHGEDEQGEHESGDDNNEEHDTPIGVWLDFDLGRSITLTGGQYYLNPVVNPFCDAKSGKVEGKVRPEAAHAVVTIFNATDTAMAIPEHDEDGEYKIRGLKAGTYSIHFKGFNGYSDTTINNIVVVINDDTHIPTVTLHN